MLVNGTLLAALSIVSLYKVRRVTQQLLLCKEMQTTRVKEVECV